MHDFSTIKKLSDTELSSLMQTLDKRLTCIVDNEQLFNLLQQQKQVIIDEQYERRQISILGLAPTIIDTSLPYEDKDKR